jgi:hypothetical protein
VNCACAGDPLGQDLASFRNVLSQFFNVFVIDRFGLVSTELANLFSAIHTSFIHHHFLLILLFSPDDR